MFLEERKNKSLSNGTGKKIIVYDFDGNILSKHETIIECSEKYKINPSYISRVCHKNFYQQNNLIFTFEDETIEQIKERFKKIEFTEQIKLLIYDKGVLKEIKKLSQLEYKEKKALCSYLRGKIQTTKHLKENYFFKMCKLGNIEEIKNKNKMKITEE